MLQQQCSNILRLSGRLDRIYSIDPVEAPSSVYEPAWLRLGEPFDATESEDDSRFVRERAASMTRRRGNGVPTSTAAHVVTEEMYTKPSEEQVAFNHSIATSLTVQPLPKQGQILQHLSNAAGLEVKDTCVFAGRIDLADATKLACTLVEAYNEKEGGIYKAGKTFPGFNNYAQHIGRHDSDSQLVSSVIFKPSYLKKTSIAEWPELHKVFMEISAKLGESFEIVVSHVLFSKNQSVCFEYHHTARFRR